MRLRIKLAHRPIRYVDGCIRIGGIVPTIGTYIAEPDEWVWALLESLDGSRTVDQVVAHLVHLFPGRSGSDVRAAIDDLVQAGYVEDADEPIPKGLSEVERERYSRSRELSRWMDLTPRFSSWDTQLQLSQASVVVVGTGGVGSTAALILTASGVGHVHCVDSDVVELSNLNRQFLFTERDLTRPKAEAAVDRLRERNSDITITGEQLTIEGPAVLQALAARFDVVLLAADKPKEIRSWANQACLTTGTDWVYGGYHGPQVNVGLYRPGTGPCYDCGRSAEREREATMPHRSSWSRAAGGTPPQAVSAVTAGFSGVLAALAAMSLITGAPALRTNCQFGLNLVTLEDSMAIGPEAPHPDCPACGPRR